MRSAILRSSVALTVLLVTAPLGAHHYSAAIFDSSKILTLVGSLTTVDWRNPHIEFSVDVVGTSGVAETWRIETMGPSWFRTRNISRTTFDGVIGQTVTVEAQAAKDGSPSGLLQKMTFPDGHSVAIPGPAQAPSPGVR